MHRIGSCEVLEELGRGGMGVVYRAHHPILGEVALKVLLPGSAGLEELARFRREGRALARLRHPGLVVVHELDVDRGRPFLVMELVQGESLEARLGRGELEGPEAARVAAALARALQHAHDHGVVHRDVKPQNVVLRPDGAPVLVDFGLARLRDPRATRLTATGELLGTPAYMAPEQVLARDPAALGPAVDVYGLGATLYRLLAGRPPFTAREVLATLAAVAQELPPPPATLRRVDLDLQDICLRCLAKDAAERYPTAGDVAVALERWLARIPTSRADPARRGGLARWLAPSIVAGGALGGALVLALAGGSGEPTRGEAAPVTTATLAGPLPDEEGGGRRAALAVAREHLASGAPAAALQVVADLLAADPHDAAAQLVRLHALWAQGRHTAAAAAVEALLADPRLPDADRARCHYVRASIRMHRGEREGAAADALDAAELGPGDRALQRDVGLLLQRLERSPEARAALERALALAPEAADPELLVELADLRMRLGDPAGAAAAVAEALAADPDRPRGRVVRAALRFERGDLEGALEDLERALALEPDRVEALCNRGTVLLELGQVERALADLTRALSLEPDLLQALAVRGLTYLKLNRPVDALADIERALAAAPHDPELHLGRGLALRMLERVDEAAEAWRQALRHDPDQDEALGRLLQLLVRLGRRDELGTEVERALARGRGHPDRLHRLVRLLHRLGHLESARRAADLGLAAAPEDARLWCARATVRRLTDDVAGARADVDRALSLEPDLVDGWRELGHVLRRSGDEAGALAAWSSGLAADPADVELLNDRGSFFVGVGQLEAAAADFEAALSIDPDMAAAHANLGMVRTKLGDHAGAARALARALELLPQSANLRGRIESLLAESRRRAGR